MAFRLPRYAVAAAALAFAATAHAQQSGSSTSTTTTKSQSTTKTTTESWKTPDGTKGGSSTTTTTSSRSQSVTVGRPSPGAQPAPALPAPGPSYGVQWMAGGWSVSEGGKRGACRVQLYTGLESGGGATSSGCQSDIKGIGNWALRGETLLLIKNVFSVAATLQRTGPSRFDGHTASGAAISIWR